MKKIYVLAVLFCTGITASALTTHVTLNVNQANWRWRNNDGAEASASWKADQNKPVSYHSPGEIIRLRIEVVNQSTQNSVNCDACQFSYPINLLRTLQFTTDTTNESSWKNIDLNTDQPFTMADSDNYVSQDEPTTPQLSSTDMLFSPGVMMVSESLSIGTFVSSPARTEHEWVIKGTANLATNTTYYFRQYFRPTGVMYVNNSYPSLTTTATLAKQLNSFAVSNEGKRIKIQWSETPDDKESYTNIQRSTDQQTWVTVSSVKSNFVNYTEYDNNPPLNSTLYYRLQQYHKDGSYSFSVTRSVKTSANGNLVVSVLPNPATTAINFKMENTGVKIITAALTDINGRALIMQTFKNIQPGGLNRLNLKQKPAPGIYVLKLTANGISESIEVIVQ